jgi:hypothetical protein
LSMFSRSDTILARIAGVWTFLSSNVSASAMCPCSTSVWLMKNCLAWLSWSENVSERPELGALHLLRVRMESLLGRLARARAPRVRPVVDPPLRVGHRHVPVLLEGVERALGRIDRDVGEVRAPEPLQLRVEVREVPPLQQRVVREVDPRHDVLRAERHLLRLGEEVVDAPVQDQPADRLHRHLFLGDDLGRVEHIEGEPLGERLVEELQAQLPFGVIAQPDGVPQVPAVEG